MTKVEKLGLVYYQSWMLLEQGFDNYFFTRLGGLSKGELSELNLSFRVGDDPEIVRQNREKVRQVIGAEKIITVRQVHSGRVIELDSGEIDPEALQNLEADGMVTEKSRAAIGVLCADCYPLLVAETEKRIIGVCHCGRRGILEGVIENTVNAIRGRGGKPGKMIAALGPGICGECYRVDETVIAEYRMKFPAGEGKIWKSGAGFYQLDLKPAILQVLIERGIPGAGIDDPGLCTFQNREFFSHRGSPGRAGRQLSAIMIK